MSGHMLTISYIAKRLDMTGLTVSNWLGVTKHVPTKRRPLPYTITRIGPRPRKVTRYHIMENDLIAYLQQYRPELAMLWKQTSIP